MKIVYVVFCFKLCCALKQLKVDPPSSISSNCTGLRDIFANASSDFIKCSIESSRPISFCEHCVNEYITVLQSYNNMSLLMENGTSCINNFVNLDRLGIVHSLYENSVDLWTRAKCYECYIMEDGIQTNNISNETVNFNFFLNEFMLCVNKKHDTEDMCQQCSLKYMVLQEYYYSISNENEKIGVCMDIVDKMNATWIYWGDNCCKFRKHPEYAFIGSIIAVLVSTVCFYILSIYCAKQKTPTIIQQSRFAEVLNTLST